MYQSLISIREILILNRTKPIVRMLLAPASATAPAPPGQVGGGCVDVRGGGARRDEEVGVAGHGL